MTASRRLLADPRLPVALFCAALVVSGSLLIALTSQLTFFFDDWDVLLHRRGFSVDAFFTDHAGHPSMGLVAIYKAIQATFGMDDLTPYAVVSTACFLTSVALLFLWMRRRVGAACAGGLAAAALARNRVRGPADAVSTRIFHADGVRDRRMLALEREDRRGDAICCALLVVAVCFQTLGLIWVVAAAVAIGLDRELRGRFWVFVVPAAVYALWYLGWGNSDANQLSLRQRGDLAGVHRRRLLLLALLAARARRGARRGRDRRARLGPAAARARLDREWGFRLVALGRVPKWFWAVLAAGLAFWFLTAINASEGRSAITPRYGSPRRDLDPDGRRRVGPQLEA